MSGEHDHRTAIAEGASVSVSYAELRTLIEINHETLLAAHRAVDKSGVLIMAFDLGTAERAGKHWMKTREGLINAMIIGRHRECDLGLPKDPTLSLRHLCLVTEPYGGARGERISFRVIDLRTGVAFQDCFGHRLEAVSADGAALIALGRYALVIVPTGDGTKLPSSAAGTWNLLADPVYLNPGTQMGLASSMPSAPTRGADGLLPDRRDASSDEPPADLGLDLDESAPERTQFSIMHGPMRAGTMLANEEAIGALEVTAEGRMRRVYLGDRTARSGVLLGCYDRCDDACLSHVTHSAVSRVHLLVLQHQDILYAIDTASTNGTFVERTGKRVRARMVKLASGMELVLADDRARVRWVELD